MSRRINCPQAVVKKCWRYSHFHVTNDAETSRWSLYTQAFLKLKPDLFIWGFDVQSSMVWGYWLSLPSKCLSREPWSCSCFGQSRSHCKSIKHVLRGFWLAERCLVFVSVAVTSRPHVQQHAFERRHLTSFWGFFLSQVSNLLWH